MADRYVRSGGTTGAWTGVTIYTTVAAALAASSAGDRIFVATDHSEATGVLQTLASAGTDAAPVLVLCATTSAKPPTSTSTGALLSTSYAFATTGVAYYEGLQFTITGTASGRIMDLGGGGGKRFKNCQFNMNNANGSGFIVTGGNGAMNEFENCGFKFSNISQSFVALGGRARMVGCSISSGSSAITNFVTGATWAWGPQHIEAIGCDWSLASSNIGLLDSVYEASLIFSNCKMPVSWNITWSSNGGGNRASYAELYNCDSGATYYVSRRFDFDGMTDTNTSVFRATDGASEHESQSLSWKISSNTNAGFPLGATRSFRLYSAPITTTGSAITATIELVHDGASALKDNEFWVEWLYQGSSTSPLGTVLSTANSNPVAAGTTLATSSATWTGATGTGPNGSSTWNTLKVSSTFTPEQKGVVTAVVHLAKPLFTVYVDPLITIT